MEYKKKRKEVRSRDKPTTRNVGWVMVGEDYESLCTSSYMRLSQNPEVQAAVNKIADLVSSMTIHLMQNTENGDVRVKNELSKMMDIHPNEWMTRKTFIHSIVRNMLLEGDGNSVAIPETIGGYIKNIRICSPSSIYFLKDGNGYKVYENGISRNPNELLHFVMNPSSEEPWRGEGYRVQLKDIVHNLKQATETKKGFMESKWKPSLVVKIDSNADEMASKEGREKIAKQYLENTESGMPWVIPTEFMEVSEVRPLSLNDLAINETVSIDKKTVASILSVPAFVVGEGKFDKEEWNNFINTRILPIAKILEQEFTRKLLISPEYYFRFNPRSLYAYSLNEMSNVGLNMRKAGIMDGNEVRDWIGMSPREGLSELTLLENYVPLDRIGDQKKLNNKVADVTESQETIDMTEKVEKVAEISLNGAQIQSLIDIVQAVAGDTLEYESAVVLITSAFPFDEKTAKKILGNPKNLDVGGDE